MNDVVWMLEFALQLQESAEQRENTNIVDNEINERREEEASDDLFSTGTSVGQVSDFNKSSGVVSVSTDSEELSSSYKESDKLMSGTVFSEIVDPKPR